MNQRTKNKLKQFFFYSTIIFRPSFWSLSSPYNPNVDAFIQEILDSNVRGNYGGHTIDFGDVRVWIGSYPYSYTSIRDLTHIGRASRYNIYRFKGYADKLKHQYYQKTYKDGMEEKEYLSLNRIAMRMLIKDE
jgi:hypothetical protein